MIFLGIVTCNRPHFFKQCYESVKKIKNLDFLAVVNDGQDDVNVDNGVFYTKNEKNLGVGKNKNILFKKALELGADHIFIMEDDIIVKNEEVLNEYIRAKNITGIPLVNKTSSNKNFINPSLLV
jgi:GT2 family glycosyltransferase